MALAPTAFELWASSSGYNTAPPVLPPRNRVYADRDTQAAFDAWNARAASIARMITESTLDTEALRAKIIAIAGEP